MHKHRSFSRRSVAEPEKLSEITQESFREDIIVNDFYKIKTSKINGYRRLKTVTGIKVGTFVKKNKLNNSSKWFKFGQKIRS